MSDAGRTVVIGLGNPLLGDDGLGLAALERLEAGWRLPPDVELVDGGTWGLMLLPEMEAAGSLLLLDAIASGAPPGEVVVVEREDLPAFLETRLSPHQVGLKDLFALLALRGTMPERTVAMGLAPGQLETTAGLSPAVRAGLDALVEEVVARLRRWGLEPSRRPPSEAAADGSEEGQARGRAACTR